MSRLGKKPIFLPSGVSLSISAEDRQIEVKGAKGLLKWKYPAEISLKESKGEQGARLDVSLEAAHKGELIDKKSKALWGLAWSKINSMTQGVFKSFVLTLEIHGIGFKAQVEGQKIIFALGASHPIIYHVPVGVTVSVDPKQTILTISGCDRELTGQVASDIRALRPPEPYKGKGIRYAGEVIVRKAGKSAAVAGSGGAKK